MKASVTVAVEYGWKSGAGYSGAEAAQEVGEHLQVLVDRHGGSLRAQQVVADAKAKRSPIHEYFTWDDIVAAKKRRLDEARELIRSVTVKCVGDKEVEHPERAFVTITAMTERGPASYMPTLAVVSTADGRAALIVKAMLEAEMFANRYHQLVEFTKVVKQICVTVNRLKGRQRASKKKR